MRLPTLSPAAYRRVTLFALLALAFIIVSGAAVRLTGSGLGCPDWPTCADNRVVAPLEYHAMVEFVNRTVTGLVSVAVILAVLGRCGGRPAGATSPGCRWDWWPASSARSSSAASPCCSSCGPAS